MGQLYDNMLKDTQRRVRDQNEESEKKLRDLQSQIQAATEANEARETELTMRLQTESNDLQMRFSEQAGKGFWSSGAGLSEG